MASVQNIRELVSNCLSGAISGSDLANRFTPILMAALKSQDVATKQLVLKVHSQLAHYVNGFISEEQLRVNLIPFGESMSVVKTSLNFHMVQHVVQQAPPETISYNAAPAFLIPEDQLQLVTTS
jgi:hypothetical protein